MSVEKIITDWKKGIFQPVYWLEGEEEYFIDMAVKYAEHHIINESEAAFNLSIFYGKDAGWPDVINACRRYPMFAERQVVIVKEAQQMKDIEKLEAYIDNPLSSTILVIAYKDKKLDARKKFAKLVKEKGVLLTTKKLYENQVMEWTENFLASKGLSITQKGLALLVDHIGNDLSRIVNEIEKLQVNIGTRQSVSEDDIERNVGISKDFNVFELTTAFASKDVPGAIRIINYFESNPKAAPIQLVLPSLYSFFSKVMMVFGAGAEEKSVATAIGVNPFFVKDYLKAARIYTYPGVEKALILLHFYNLKSVGIRDSGTEDASLLREMAVKIMS